MGLKFRELKNFMSNDIHGSRRTCLPLKQTAGQLNENITTFTAGLRYGT